MIQMAPEIRIEALRIARSLVKDKIRENGMKICCFKATELTDYAKTLMSVETPMARLLQQEIINQAWDICKIRHETTQGSHENVI